MNNYSNVRILIFALLTGMLYSCAPRPIVINNDFVLSSRNPSEVLYELRKPDVAVNGISGRARAQYSGPGSSERSTVTFASDRDRTLLVFRNSLGIEGGRLLVEPDSVTFYNRIEQVAQKVGADNHDALFDNGIYAVNMLSILNPDLEKRSPRRIYENESAWRITFDDHVSMVFDKSNGDLMQFDFRVLNNFAFSTYLFANYTEIDGYRFPRNIQITTVDKKANIFLNMQSYVVNPAYLDLTLDIPGHVRIDRQ